MDPSLVLGAMTALDRTRDRFGGATTGRSYGVARRYKPRRRNRDERRHHRDR